MAVNLIDLTDDKDKYLVKVINKPLIIEEAPKDKVSDTEDANVPACLH